MIIFFKKRFSFLTNTLTGTRTCLQVACPAFGHQNSGPKWFASTLCHDMEDHLSSSYHISQLYLDW